MEDEEVGGVEADTEAGVGAAMDPLIHQRTRLRIMVVLYRNRQVPYVTLRDTLGLTDGNLASHVAKLEESGYVRSRRVLLGREGFELRYLLTDRGEAAFRAYMRELRKLLGQAEERSARGAGPASGDSGTGDRPDRDEAAPA